MHTGAGRASSRKAEPPGSAASSQQTYHRAIAPDRLREQVAHRRALPQSARPSQPPRDSSAAKACCTDDRQEKATQEGGVLYPKPQPELDPGFSPTELDCQLYTRSIGGHVHQMSRIREKVLNIFANIKNERVLDTVKLQLPTFSPQSKVVSVRRKKHVVIQFFKKR